jgi:hypothetical protein
MKVKKVKIEIKGLNDTLQEAGEVFEKLSELTLKWRFKIVTDQFSALRGQVNLPIFEQ